VMILAVETGDGHTEYRHVSREVRYRRLVDGTWEPIA
jgi:hypothetical protein